VHNYERLEKIYYKKQIIKFSIIIGAVIIFSVLINVLYFNYKKYFIAESNNTALNSTNREINKSVTVAKNTVKEIKFEVKKIKKETEKIESNKNSNEELLKLSFEIPKISLKTKKVEKKSKKIVEQKEVKKIEKKVPVKNVIIEEDNVDINELVKFFNNSPSFDLAIQIAEYYLNKNNLDLAKKWALKANSLDPSRYESWKIFAIILIKKNEKDKAKEVLKTYLNDYGENDEVEKLLRSINE
jgi:predicted Zn-dependent protease